MQLYRVVLSWAGSAIKGTAVTVLHFDGSNQSAPPVAAIKSAFDTVASILPTGVTVVTPNSGDAIEDTTGALTGVWNGIGGGTSSGSGPGNCAAGVGACVTWTTGGIVNGTKGPRKLRGRTFVVPLHNACYDTDGTLYSTAFSTMQSFATQLQAAGPLAVWHRPASLAAANGTSYGVLSHSVRDKVAYLKSRRD